METHWEANLSSVVGAARGSASLAAVCGALRWDYRSGSQWQCSSWRGSARDGYQWENSRTTCAKVVLRDSNHGTNGYGCGVCPSCYETAWNKGPCQAIEGLEWTYGCGGGS